MFRRGVFPAALFLLFHVKNAALQNAIRQRVEKFFEKSFKKIWRQYLIIYIFASLNIDKHYESKRICKKMWSSRFDRPKMD